MYSPDRYSFKNNCRKIMQAAILLLGFFVFSNLVISSQPGPAVVQTTWVTCTNSRVIQGFQYPVKSATVYIQHVAAFLSTRILNLCRFHSKLADVSLKLHSGVILSKPLLSNFCCIKIIPQSGKNDAHPILS